MTCVAFSTPKSHALHSQVVSFKHSDSQFPLFKNDNCKRCMSRYLTYIVYLPRTSDFLPQNTGFSDWNMCSYWTIISQQNHVKTFDYFSLLSNPSYPLRLYGMFQHLNTKCCLRLKIRPAIAHCLQLSLNVVRCKVTRWQQVLTVSDNGIVASSVVGNLHFKRLVK